MLTVTKQDANTHAPLKGATFVVCSTDPSCPEGPPVAHLTTDETGTAQLSLGTLSAGTYCVRETGVPSGYLLMPAYTPSQCFPSTADATIAVTDPPGPSPTPSPTPTPTPSPTPTPTPSPTPAPTGELQITKTDPGGKTVTAPGFTFNVHVGSAAGQVIATIATDGSGIAVAAALNPATYCVEEISAGDGYQLAPTYSPAACVSVASDPTQGRAPTIVSVIDPPAATATPGAAGSDVTPSPSATPHTAAGPAPPLQPPSSWVAAVARGLVGAGALLLLAGVMMIGVGISRRRRPPAGGPPADYWYDSTIT